MVGKMSDIVFRHLLTKTQAMEDSRSSYESHPVTLRLDVQFQSRLLSALDRRRIRYSFGIIKS